jgi:putative membrane protein
VRKHILLFLKGIAMGAANVIPGVSGGTIAFITNIYEDLINALKAFDIKAIRYLFSLKIKEFSEHISFPFLLALFSGVFVSIISLGKVLGYLFGNYPVYVWAFFFGLILASIYFVGRTISKWSLATIWAILIGVSTAVIITNLNPVNQNENTLYLFVCGIIAMASMLLPGLSGSFVLILMGNYQLIFLEAVPNFNLIILTPVVLGSIAGFIILSRIISFLLKRFRDGTIGMLTGFIVGSLLIIWPWKNPEYLLDEAGEIIIRKGNMIIEGYTWFLPEIGQPETWISVFFIFLGIVIVIVIETIAQKSSNV